MSGLEQTFLVADSFGNFVSIGVEVCLNDACSTSSASMDREVFEEGPHDCGGGSDTSTYDKFVSYSKQPSGMIKVDVAWYFRNREDARDGDKYRIRVMNLTGTGFGFTGPVLAEKELTVRYRDLVVGESVCAVAEPIVEGE